MLIVDADGKIGLGTASPSADLKLDVEGQVGATEYCDENGSNCKSINDIDSAETMIDGWPDVIKCNDSNAEYLLWHQYGQKYVVEAPDGDGVDHGSRQYSTSIEFNADGTYARHIGASQQNWLCANGGDIAGKSISQLYAEGKAFNLVAGSSTP